MKIFLLTLFLLPNLSFSSEKEALLVIQGLGKNLKKELMAGMKKSPEEALKVCNTRASGILGESQMKNIFVGRVSLKARNPKNAPQKWMLDTIKSYHNGTNKKPHTVVQINKYRMGIIKPIKVMPLCLNCHGTNLKPEIQKKISELYPNDKATGYKNGDIRGFFWADYEKQ